MVGVSRHGALCVKHKRKEGTPIIYHQSEGAYARSQHTNGLKSEAMPARRFVRWRKSTAGITLTHPSSLPSPPIVVSWVLFRTYYHPAAPPPSHRLGRLLIIKERVLRRQGWPGTRLQRRRRECR